MSRYKLWKDWSKHCLNHPVYKFLVLIGLAYSPSFSMHRAVKECLEQHQSYEYSVRDEKPDKTEKSKKNNDVNWGWYTVYIILIIADAIVCAINNFDISTWQYWAYSWMLILCFVAGAHYRKTEE